LPKMEGGVVTKARGAFFRGWITKKGGAEGGRRSWKRRWFVLTDDEVLYFKTDNEDEPPLKTLSLEDYVTARVEHHQNDNFLFGVFQTSSRVLDMKVEQYEQMQLEELIRFIATLGELIQCTKAIKTKGSSPSGFQNKLIAVNLEFVTFATRLLSVGKVMVHTTRNISYKEELGFMIKKFPVTVINVVQSCLSVIKSPYEERLRQQVAQFADVALRLLADIVKVSVRENKGSGVENKQNREDFVFALKGIKAPLTSIQELAELIPGAYSAKLEEIKDAFSEEVSFLESPTSPSPFRSAQISGMSISEPASTETLTQMPNQEDRKGFEDHTEDHKEENALETSSRSADSLKRIASWKKVQLTPQQKAQQEDIETL